MRRTPLLHLALALALFSLEAKAPPRIDGKRMLEDIKVLSSDRFQGRFTGTKELDEAGAYIAEAFQKAGLKAVVEVAGDKPSYFQKLIVNTDTKLGARNTLRVGSDELTVAKHYLPMVSSASGDVSGELVFGGYGISAKDYNYDDFDGLDLKGRVLLLLRYEPQDGDEKSIFQGKERSFYASLMTKISNAKLRGAAAVLIVNNPLVDPGKVDDLDHFAGGAGQRDSGIPVLQVQTSKTDAWFAAAGRPLKPMLEAMDADLKPRSFVFPEELKVTLHTEVERVLSPTYNVAGYLPGETGEYIVIGAHYDHLGYGLQFSMAPNEVPKIHPGADDNASGSAAVMELARHFAKLPKQRRGILFVTFTGEELGLFGSSHLSQNLPLPAGLCVAMINMDMVGRMKAGRFFVGGVGTGSTFRPILEKLVAGAKDLKPDFSGNLNVGGSDHTSFLARQIPSLFFFSGLHSDYHKPSDTWEKIEVPGYARLVTVVAGMARDLVQREDKPEFRKLESKAPADSSSSGGYGPYFGSVPDFAEVPTGVRLADIRSGSPADKAGLKAGDTLIEFDGKKVGNLEDYTFLLRLKKVGDRVEVKVKRLDQELSFTVVLAARN